MGSNYSSFAAGITGVIVVLITLCYKIYKSPKSIKMIELTSVNYHFTRKCNYKCGFCFHTAKNSHVENLENAKKIILAVRQQGGKKLNFAGGEPFLPEYHERLGEMVKYAKQIGFESVSIISNGKFIKEKWFKDYGQFLDMLGISCDSTNESINSQIGRGNGDHVTTVRAAAELCKKYKIMFKLNTVVNSYNWNTTDMIEFINEIKPNRWKIFQVLALEGENSGNKDEIKRNVTDFLITKEQFQTYIHVHKQSVVNAETIMKVEDNGTMQSSYILIDEYGCFLDSSTGSKKATSSILGAGGITQALVELSTSAGGGFDKQSFHKRDGIFEWTNTNKTKNTNTKNTSNNTTNCCDNLTSFSPTSVTDIVTDMEDLKPITL